MFKIIKIVARFVCLEYFVRIFEVSAKQVSDDINLMLEENPLQDKNDKIWKTRILNFTNYDVVNESEELQQIV